MVHEWESCSVCIQTMSCNILGLLVAYWLKHWTTDQKIQGSSPTSSTDLFLFWVHSALPHVLLIFYFFLIFFFMVLPGMTQLMRKSPIALRLILRGFPGIDGLTSPPKDAKENLLLNL